MPNMTDQEIVDRYPSGDWKPSDEAPIGTEVMALTYGHLGVVVGTYRPAPVYSHSRVCPPCSCLPLVTTSMKYDGWWIVKTDFGYEIQYPPSLILVGVKK